MKGFLKKYNYQNGNPILALPYLTTHPALDIPHRTVGDGRRADRMGCGRECGGGEERSRRKVDRHVPWTLMIPLERTGERMFECACHDGNYGLEAILRGTREQEKQST